MPTYAVGSAAYPSPSELRDIILDSIAYAYDQQGLIANILPGTDHFIRAEKFAEQVSIAISNNQIALSAVSPLTATGTDLENLAGVFGVFKRPASSASGYMVVKVPATYGSNPPITVSIPAGFVCTAPDGFKYKTVSAKTVGLNEQIQVVSLLTGLAANQVAGTLCAWDSGSIGQLLPTCVVSAGGLVGGADADDDDVLRRRLLQRLAFPGAGGNTAQVVQLAEASSAAVWRAFAYAGVQGPASYDVAVVAATGTRDPGPQAISLANAAVVSNMPGHAQFNITGITPQYMDVSFALNLALPSFAGGAGGGWRDSTPWPAEETRVTNYDEPSDTITVDSVTAPAAGNRIGIWDPTTEDADGNLGVMHEYEIDVVSGVSGAWTVTVMGGFAVDHDGAYVSAGAVNLVQYAKTARTEFEKLGPGEKTANSDLLPRARRQPTPDVAAQPGLNRQILKGLLATHSNMIDVDYGVRYETGTTVTRIAPGVPTTAADPPKILVLKYLAFRRAT